MSDEKVEKDPQKEARVANIIYLCELKLAVADVRELWMEHGLSTFTRNMVCMRLEDVTTERKTETQLKEIASKLVEEDVAAVADITVGPGC